MGTWWYLWNLHFHNDLHSSKVWVKQTKWGYGYMVVSMKPSLPQWSTLLQSVGKTNKVRLWVHGGIYETFTSTMIYTPPKCGQNKQSEVMGTWWYLWNLHFHNDLHSSKVWAKQTKWGYGYMVVSMKPSLPQWSTLLQSVGKTNKVRLWVHGGIYETFTSTMIYTPPKCGQNKQSEVMGTWWYLWNLHFHNDLHSSKVWAKQTKWGYGYMVVSMKPSLPQWSTLLQSVGKTNKVRLWVHGGIYETFTSTMIYTPPKCGQNKQSEVMGTWWYLWNLHFHNDLHSSKVWAKQTKWGYGYMVVSMKPSLPQWSTLLQSVGKTNKVRLWVHGGIYETFTSTMIYTPPKCGQNKQSEVMGTWWYLWNLHFHNDLHSSKVWAKQTKWGYGYMVVSMKPSLPQWSTLLQSVGKTNKVRLWVHGGIYETFTSTMIYTPPKCGQNKQSEVMGTWWYLWNLHFHNDLHSSKVWAKQTKWGYGYMVVSMKPSLPQWSTLLQSVGKTNKVRLWVHGGIYETFTSTMIYTPPKCG